MGNDRQQVTCELLKTAVMNDNSSLHITRHLLSQHEGSWSWACADTPLPWRLLLWVTLQMIFWLFGKNDAHSLLNAQARAYLTLLHSLNLLSSPLSSPFSFLFLSFHSFPLLYLPDFLYFLPFVMFLLVPSLLVVSMTSPHPLVFALTLALNISNSQMFRI